MAGGFGGAIKLSGESEYRRALQQITQALRENASEATAVASAYDKNDKSVDALRARSEDLAKVLERQKSTLADATNAYESFKAKVDDQRTAHDALVKQYDNEKNKLEELKRTHGESSTEYQNQLKVVEDLSKKVTDSTKNYDANELALSKLRVQMNNAQAVVNRTTVEMDNLGEETEDSGKKAKEASEGYTVFKNVLANLSTKVIEGVVRGLKQVGSAMVDIGKQAIANYGEFEQMQGGVKKIFGDDVYQSVIDNANKAFSTAGLSANKYLETVTGFSASLIQSLDGDQAKAVEIADRAIKDMADNANTYGTSIESIQYAYMGFAKQNYTMLDNLKLGYGGTKKEMERLISDASKMTDEMQKLGITVEAGDLSFANIANAISVVQSHLEIMGTTSNEASGTIQGSISAMKASWQNLLTGIADDNADFTQLVDNFVSTLVTPDGGGVIGNLKDRIATVIRGIGEMIHTLLPVLIETIVPIISDNLPVVLSAVQDALTAIMDLLPTIMPTIQALIPQIVSELINNLPMIINTGIEFILSLLQGIIDATPQLINQLPLIIEEVERTIIDNLPRILRTGIELIGSLIAGIYQAMFGLVAPAVKVIATFLQGVKSMFSNIWNAGKEIISNVIAGMKSLLSSMWDIGSNIVSGIWSGISDGYWWIRNKIAGWVGNVTSFIKSLFGIASPSKLFRDEIGENLALGIGEGFEAEMGDVSKMMADSIPTSFDVATSVKTSGQSEMYNMVEAFKEALSEMKIELDDENMGKFVENTVSRAVYAF